MGTGNPTNKILIALLFLYRCKEKYRQHIQVYMRRIQIAYRKKLREAGNPRNKTLRFGYLETIFCIPILIFIITIIIPCTLFYFFT
jgi:hypothetical protein